MITSIPAERVSKAGWRLTKGIWEPLLIIAVTRIALVALSFAGQLLLPLNSGNYWHAFPDNLFLDGWLRWDSGWYLSIVKNGYTVDPETYYGSVAFFPLYPALVWLAAQLTGDVAIAGLLVANASFAVAAVGLYQLALIHFDQRVAWLSVLLFCVFPFAFFFSAMYTESLFVALTILSFLFAERGKWWAAGLLGLLAASTRLVGIILAPALLVLYLERRNYQWRRIRADVLALGLIPVGLLLFMGYLYVRFGDPLMFMKSALVGWAHYTIFAHGFGPLNPLYYYPGNYDLTYLVNFGIVVLWLCAVIPTLRLLGPSYAVFTLLGILIPFSSAMESLGRYLSVVFPVYMTLATCLRPPWLTRFVVAASAMGLGIFTILFANWYWVI